MTEYIRGALDGTMHRLDRGHRTGVIWGPGVDGGWYGSRSQVADGDILKFADWASADKFLRADIGSPTRVFTGHMRYSHITVKTGKRHPDWSHNPADARPADITTPHELVADPCTCGKEPPPPVEHKGRRYRKFAIPTELAAMHPAQKLTSGEIAAMLKIRQATVTDWWRKGHMWSEPTGRKNKFGEIRKTNAGELMRFLERRNNA